MSTTVEIISAYLAGSGVQKVYGVPGDGSSLDLIEAFRRAGVEFVAAYQSSGAAIMAATDADISHRVGICILPGGQGVAAAIPGLARAHLDRLPMIVIAEGPPRPDGRTSTRMALDHGQLVRGVTKDGATITSSRAQRLISWAWGEALASPAGPVYLELPADQAVRPAMRRETSQPGRQVEGPSPNAIRKIARLLIRAGRAVVIAGMGCREGKVPPALRELVEHLGSPIFTTRRAKGVIPEDHPLAAGIFVGGGAEDELLSRAECVLAIGLDSVEVLPRSWKRRPPVVSLRAYRGSATLYESAAEAVGDLTQGLLQLREELPPAGEWSSADWARRGERFRARIRSLLADASRVRGSQWMAPHRVVEIAREVFPRPTLAVVDAGAHSLAVAAFWDAYEAKGFICSSGQGGAGYAIPAAVGARLAVTDRPVLAFVGESGLLLGLAEAATASRLGVPLTILVFLDESFSWVRVAQEQRRYAPIGVSVGAMDIPKLAEGVGACAVVVEEEEGLRAALHEAAGMTGPAIVAARVNPHGYRRMVELLRGKAVG